MAYPIDTSTLPSTKSDQGNLRAAAGQSVTAAEFNKVVTALKALNDAFAAGKGLTLVADTSLPVSNSGGVAVRSNTGVLEVSKNGGPYRATEPATFNVKDYGAVGDGTADDTTAIRAAITAAEVTGGIVFFPPGTYAVRCSAGAIVGTNAALYVQESNVAYQGVRGQSKLLMRTRAGLSPASNWETVQTSGLAAWQATHAYSLGAAVLANGHEWECSTAGTSAGSVGPVLPGSPTPDVNGAVFITDGSATWRYRDHMFVGHLFYIKKGINQNVDTLRNIAFRDLEFDMDAGGWPDADYPLAAGNLQPWTNGGYGEVMTGKVFDSWNKAFFFDGNLIDGVRFERCNLHGNRAEGIYYGGSTMDNVQILDCDLHHTGGSIISASAGMVIERCRIYHSGTLSESFHTNKDIIYRNCLFYDSINGIVDGSNTDITGSASWGRELVQGCTFRNCSIRAFTNGGYGDNYEIANCVFIDCGYASSAAESVRLASGYGGTPRNMLVHDNLILADLQAPQYGITLAGLVSSVEIYNNLFEQTNTAKAASRHISRAFNLGLNAGAEKVRFRGNRCEPGVTMAHTSDETTEQYAGLWDPDNMATDGTPTYSLIVANGSTSPALKYTVVYVGGNTNHAFANVPALKNATNAQDAQVCIIGAAGSANNENWIYITKSSSTHLLLADRYIAGNAELVVKKDNLSGKWVESAYRRKTDRQPVTANDLDLTGGGTSIAAYAPQIQAYNCAQVSLAPGGATTYNNWLNFILGVPVKVIVNANVTLAHNAGGSQKLKMTGAADWTPGGTGGHTWFEVPVGGTTAIEIGPRVTY